jgi:hypothetical protein
MGLKNGVFYKKEDGSVWINLTDEGLDEKLVLRSDGTSVYNTRYWNSYSACKRLRRRRNGLYCW